MQLQNSIILLYTYDGETPNGYRDTIVAKNEPHADQVTQYVHSDTINAGLVTKEIYPDGTPVVSTYNANGTLATKTDQRGWTTIFTRDALGRVTREDATDTSSQPVQGVNEVLYTYDALGRLTTQESYDSRGFVSIVQDAYEWSDVPDEKLLTTTETQIQASGSESLSNTVTAETDQVTGTVSSLTYPSGWKLNYLYDDLHRMTDIHDGFTILTTYRYAGDHLAQRTLADTDVTWGAAGSLGQYDAYGRLTTCNYKTGTGTDIVKINYAYDKASDVTWRYDELMQGQTVPANWSQKYTYDDLHRLIKAQHGAMDGTWPTSPAMSTPDYNWTWDDQQTGGPALDKLGNWEYFDNNGTADVREHNTTNEIIARDVGCDLRAVDYDANGNLITLDRETPTGTERLEFTYDYRNRLITVKKDGTEIANYYYDVLNRRIKKDLTTGTDVVYLYNGWQCIEEHHVDNDTTTVRENVYGGQFTDEIIVTRQSATSSLTYYLHDAELCGPLTVRPSSPSPTTPARCRSATGMNHTAASPSPMQPEPSAPRPTPSTPPSSSRAAASTPKQASTTSATVSTAHNWAGSFSEIHPGIRMG